VGREHAAGEREMWGGSARWGSVRCGWRGHGGGASDVGGDDFPITIGVFLFSNYPVRPFRLFQQKFTTEPQNCRVVVCRVVSWRGVVWCHFMCQPIIPKFPFHILKKTCTYISKYQKCTCIDYITALLEICT
jgi:hypothetical protein